METWPSDVKLCPQVDRAGVVCGRPSHCKGLCALHFTRHREGRDMLAPVASWTKPVGRCIRDECQYPAYARGLCNAHYQRHIDQRDTGKPIFRKRSPLSERAKVWFDECAKVGDCWEYPRLNANGYPTHVHDEDGQSITRYRAVYIGTRGRPPKWAQIHHACANRACINPDHLVLASQSQNIAEMRARAEYERRIADLERRLAEHHCAGCACT